MTSAGDDPLAVLRALALGDAPTAEAVAARVRPLLRDAAWLDAAIAAMAVRARAAPDWEPSLVPLSGGMQTGLLLHADRHVAIFAGVGDRSALAAKRLGARRGAIVFTGQLGLVRVIAGGGAALSLWRGGWRGGRPAARCEPAGARRLVDGETFEIDGRDTAYLIERATRDFVLLQATIAADSAPAACEYDYASRALTGLGAARDDCSRRQMLATLLAALDMPDASAFDAASRAAEPYVRWHAMRAWTSVDAGAAAARLAEMASADADAEVRSLASRTLSCLA